jgi:hypothetical protein
MKGVSMGTKAAQPVERRWAHLDSIAVYRRGELIRKIQSEINSAQASMDAAPLNGGGWNDPHRTTQREQIMAVIGVKEREIERLNSLSGDELVIDVCGEDLARQYAQPVELRNPDGSPLARGAVGAGAPPGWGSARNA